MATINQINSNFHRIVEVSDSDGMAKELKVNLRGNITGEAANANYASFSGVADSANVVDGANVSGEVANANYSSYAGDVVNSSQPNITSVGNLTTLTVAGTTETIDLNVTGNVLGSLLPNANITYDLGAPTQRWKDIYLANNTIYLGDSALSVTDGNLTLDGNTLISQSSQGVTDLGDASNLQITGGSSGQVLSTDGAGNLSWTTVSSNASEIANTDGYSTYTVSVSDTGVVSMNTARGGLEFGAQPEEGAPQHLHIMRSVGQGSSTDLYFGDDYNYVKMPGLYGPGTQGVEIGSSYDGGPVSTWRFETDGGLTIPGNLTAAVGASPAPSLSGFSSINAFDTISVGDVTISSNGEISGSTSIGNVAAINLNGNASQVLSGNGTWIAAGSGSTYGNSNVTTLLANLGNNSISTTGNVTANNFIGNVSITSNITGTGSNVSLVAGSYTATFDNTGVLTLPTIGGDEGGEINLGIPATNTTLTSPVKVDVFQDRIRFFDGSTKGAYIDLSQAGVAVSTLLNNRVAARVNAGTFVTMDNIKATVTTSSPRGLSLATVTGSFSYDIGGTFGGFGVGSSGTAAGGQTLTTTPTASIFGWGFTNQGDIATYVLTDTTNNRCYRITVQIGNGFFNNSIVIERLI